MSYKLVLKGELDALHKMYVLYLPEMEKFYFHRAPAKKPYSIPSDQPIHLVNSQQSQMFGITFQLFTACAGLATISLHSCFSIASFSIMVSCFVFLLFSKLAIEFGISSLS